MQNEIIPNKLLCNFCNTPISSDIFQDHILCHQINEEETNKKDNIINNPFINNKTENKKTEENNKFTTKFFGFFENIGNKAKEIFKKEEKEEEKEEHPSKISIFFNNFTDKISQTFDEIKQEISKKLDKSDDSDDETPFRFISNKKRDYRDDNNIDDLLLRFEEEDAINNNKKENLFKEEDANEILRYIPNSIITQEKNENDDNYKCVICLFEFKIGDKVCTLPCLHIFHVDCLKNWIIRNRWCPICKIDCSLDSLFNNNIADI